MAQLQQYPTHATDAMDMRCAIYGLVSFNPSLTPCRGLVDESPNQFAGFSHKFLLSQRYDSEVDIWLYFLPYETLPLLNHFH